MGIGDGGIEGNPSDSKTFTTRVPKPNKVTNIQIEDMSPTSVLLRWDKDAGDTWYIVSYRKQGTGEWTTQTVHDNVISIPGLLPSTLYEFKVTGRNEFASGEDSDTIVHKTKEGGLLGELKGTVDVRLSLCNYPLIISWSLCTRKNRFFQIGFGVMK